MSSYFVLNVSLSILAPVSHRFFHETQNEILGRVFKLLFCACSDRCARFDIIDTKNGFKMGLNGMMTTL